MEKNLLELAEVATKAARREADEHKCLKALSHLKSFPVTLEALASTNVGSSIRSLAKHSSKNIQDLASDVIAIWQKRVLNLKESASFKKSSADPPKASNEVNSQSQNPLPKVNSIPKCQNPMRDKIREQIFEALCMVFSDAQEDSSHGLDSCDPVGVAVTLESTLMSKWGISNNRCRNKYRSLLFNLKDPKNPDFRKKILLEEIRAEQVAELNATEMASNERQRENEAIKARALWKCHVRKKESESTPTGLFKCGKCGERRTTYYQMQTRSADEPMTSYVTCLKCEHRWKC